MRQKYWKGMFIRLILVGLALSIPTLTHSTEPEVSDDSIPQLERQRSRALAQQIERNDKESLIQWQGQSPETFLTLYLSASNGAPRASLLMIHGNRQHPDWPGLIHQARTRLPEVGWNTLSIAIPDLPVQFEPPVVHAAEEPVAPNEADDTAEPEAEPAKEANASSEETTSKIADSPPPLPIYPEQEIRQHLEKRLDIAISQLRSKSPVPVFILAQGTAATLLQQQIDLLSTQRISGIILVNPAPVKSTDGQISYPEASLFPFPVLDLAPQSDAASNPQTRKNAAARQRKRDYQLRVIPGTASNFDGSEAILIKVIRGWAKSWM